MLNRMIRGQGMSAGRGKNNPQRRGLSGTSICRCPKCGHTQVHTRGVPCSRLACPKCGTPLRGERCL